VFVTFKDSQGADTTFILSGATKVDLSITITPAPDYQLPAATCYIIPTCGRIWFAYIVVSLDKNIELSEKITIGTSVVNDKVKKMDQKFQVSGKTKSAFTVTEQKVSTMGSAIRYVFTGESWVTGAINKVAKAAGEVRQKAKEKAPMAEEERTREMLDDYAKLHRSPHLHKA
ncbi:hypothetical protein AQUCO_04700119v1, partial [Aquilegia coerulea]